jgi:ABC-2 type transport system permease protein
MSGSFSAEIIKLGRRPTTWVLLGVALVLSLLFRYFLPYSSYLTGNQGQQARAELLARVLPDQLVGNSIGGFPVFVGALALILGALAVGSDYGWGTVGTALTQGPSRLRVYAGKLLALAVIVLAGVLVLFAAGALTSAIIAMVESRPLQWPAPADLAGGVGFGWLILTMWTAFGAMLGFLFKSVALPVGLGVVWILAVENLVSSVAESLLTSLRWLRDALPGANAGSLVWWLVPDFGRDGTPPGVVDAVSGTRAIATIALYLAVFVLAGAAVLRRRDVTQ